MLCIFFIDCIPIYCHTNLFIQYIYFVIRHREMTTSLFIEHLFNATAYGVYHIEIHGVDIVEVLLLSYTKSTIN